MTGKKERRSRFAGGAAEEHAHQLADGFFLRGRARRDR